MKFDTRCLHSGKCSDTITGGINTPIFPSTAHEYVDAPEVFYPRYFNTVNQRVIEQKLSALENTESSIIFSSGMAAISSVVLTFLHAGDHVVLLDEIYGGAHAFIEQFMNRFGITHTFVPTDVAAMEKALTPATKMIYIESPTNPLLSVIDIKKVAELAKGKNCMTVIDNTFATPVFQNPFTTGIDIVIHSGTKYFGGHSDLSCGTVSGSKEHCDKVRKTAVNFGGNINPLTAYLLERSMKTLGIRVRKQADNAQILAEYLQSHPNVKNIHYPGLASHPAHAVANVQMSGFGAILSFEPDDTITADCFMKKLTLITPAVSLGGIETTICDPARTANAKVSPEVRRRQGITDNLMRLSVGIEDAGDLIADLNAGFGTAY